MTLCKHATGPCAGLDGCDPSLPHCPACGRRIDDPYPVGTEVFVADFDGSTLGPFVVARSYWPSACVELLTGDGLVRQSHDRMRRAG